MKKKIKVAMIGLGAIGERVLRKFQYHSGIELVAVCDLNTTRLVELEDELEEVSIHTNVTEMLNENVIDLVYIGVPPKFHYEIALEVLQAGKHVLCEKPLASSLADAERMLEAAKEAQVLHAMNFPMVYTNVFQLMKEKVTSGELGAIKRIEVHLQFSEWPRAWQRNNWISSRDQGGFIREVAPHYVHMVRDMFGPLTFVQSFVEYPENPAFCETSFVAYMKLLDGTPVLFNGVSTIGQKEHLQFKVFGDEATIELVNWSQLIQSSLEKGPTILPIERTEQHDIVMELVNAIEGKEATIVSFEEGFEVQNILEQMLQS